MSLPDSGPPRPWAVVEIAHESGEDERARLIRAAYRSSGSGLVALALRGVTREAVDRALDGVVDARNGALKGVVYLDAAHDAELLATAAQASIVIASTENFRARLRAHGVVAVGAGDDAALQSLRGAESVSTSG
jgi:hypothetical protein